MNRTIILCPVYNNERTLREWMRVVESLNPSPLEVVFCENNSTDLTVNIINGWDFPHKLIRFWVKDNPIDEPYYINCYNVIAHARQLLLTYARSRDCDYAIFLDSDVIPANTDFITRITKTGYDLVGGAYMRMFPEGLCVAAYYFGSTKGKYKLSRAVKNPLQSVAAVGGGCMCLSKKLVDDRRVDFYPLYDLKDNAVAEDFGYCVKAREVGYDVWLDASNDLVHDSRVKVKPWTMNRDGTFSRWTY